MCADKQHRELSPPPCESLGKAGAELQGLRAPSVGHSPGLSTLASAQFSRERKDPTAPRASRKSPVLEQGGSSVPTAEPCAGQSWPAWAPHLPGSHGDAPAASQPGGKRQRPGRNSSSQGAAVPCGHSTPGNTPLPWESPGAPSHTSSSLEDGKR